MFSIFISEIHKHREGRTRRLKGATSAGAPHANFEEWLPASMLRSGGVLFMHCCLGVERAFLWCGTRGCATGGPEELKRECEATTSREWESQGQMGRFRARESRKQ